MMGWSPVARDAGGRGRGVVVERHQDRHAVLSSVTSSSGLLRGRQTYTGFSHETVERMSYRVTTDDAIPWTVTTPTSIESVRSAPIDPAPQIVLLVLVIGGRERRGMGGGGRWGSGAFPCSAEASRRGISPPEVFLRRWLLSLG